MGKAWTGWWSLQQSRAFRKVPAWAKALGMLAEEKFAKVIASVHSPAAERVRTNNQGERCNRHWRWLEKLRYQWRRRRWVVRYVVRFLNRSWAAKFGEPARPPAIAGQPRQQASGAHGAGAQARRRSASATEPEDDQTRRPTT